MRVPVGDVFSALTTYVGSTYINQFNKFGLSLQVYAQADSQFRLQPDDLLNMYVRSQDGNMVPIGTLAHLGPSLPGNMRAGSCRSSRIAIFGGLSSPVREGRQPRATMLQLTLSPQITRNEPGGASAAPAVSGPKLMEAPNPCALHQASATMRPHSEPVLKQSSKP
ncbi:MAG: Efflux pump membrane transporter BepE [Beijerinckiaceae bacterium]|nr:MAG: Efflux pump membrane transporter BepE [Beijerinckiaceae bacterium]